MCGQWLILLTLPWHVDVHVRAWIRSNQNNGKSININTTLCYQVEYFKLERMAAILQLWV